MSRIQLAALLACLPALAAAAKRTKCSSNLQGDFQFEACGAFCKAEKAGNHCKFCKCKACSFCAATPPSEAALPTTPRLEDPMAQPAPQKRKRKQAVPAAAALESAGGMPPSALSALVPAGTTESSPVVKPTAEGKPGKKKVACSSGLQGDYKYETCGAFCKVEKSVNHCKFCKCRTCGFCAAAATERTSAPAATLPAPAPAPVQTAGAVKLATPAYARGGVASASATGSAGGHSRGVLVAIGVLVLLVILLTMCGMDLRESCRALRRSMGLPQNDQKSLINEDDEFPLEHEAGEGSSAVLAIVPSPVFGERVVVSEGTQDQGSMAGKTWDGGRLRNSREILDKAFESVEKLEASLNR